MYLVFVVKVLDVCFKGGECEVGVVLGGGGVFEMVGVGCFVDFEVW